VAIQANADEHLHAQMNEMCKTTEDLRFEVLSSHPHPPKNALPKLPSFRASHQEPGGQ
jgi:hypothetical protein